MIIKLHSFSVPIEIDTEKIKAFVHSLEHDKIELVVEGQKSPVIIDEELWQLEEAYQKGQK